MSGKISLHRFLSESRFHPALCLSLVLVAAVSSRLFLASLPRLAGAEGISAYCQFDCGWYRSVIFRGYDLVPRGNPNGDAANWVFFPLFPLLMKGVMLFAPRSWFSEVAAILNSIFFVGSCLLLYRIAARHLGNRSAALGVALFAYFPATFYFFSVYAESLFLFLALLAIILLQDNRFIAAGLVAALLSATRNQGVFIVFVILAYGIARYRAVQEAPSSERRDLVLDVGLALLLAPIGMLLFSFYLHWLTGDALAFVHLQRAWNRVPGNPVLFLSRAALAGDAYQAFCLASALAGCLAAAWLASIRRYGEACFTAIYVVTTVLSGSLMAMPRYVFTSVGMALLIVTVFPTLPRPVLFTLLIGEIILLASMTSSWFRTVPWLI